MEIKHDFYCYVAKWKGDLRLKFGLPILHPRIEFTHLDTGSVCNCRPFGMGLSYKMPKHGEARNIFLFV